MLDLSDTGARRGCVKDLIRGAFILRAIDKFKKRDPFTGLDNSMG